MSLYIETVKGYLVDIIPWILLGIGVSFVLEKFVDHKIFKKFSGKFTITKILEVQVLGMFSPLSIMSFLPVASELVSWGVSPGLLLSFFIAERSYDLQSFLIIRQYFGSRMAILNLFAILVSLTISAVLMRNEVVSFKTRRQKEKSNFWFKQLKLLVIVFFGILFGAMLRVLVPQSFVAETSGGVINGLLSGTIFGFTLYLGPIVANYPVAKAMLDLGMSNTGVFAFLTVTPVFNFIIILLFGAAVGFKKAIKSVAIYTLSAIFMTLVCSLFL